MKKGLFIVLWVVVSTLFTSNSIASAKRDGFWEVKTGREINNDVLFDYASEETHALSDFDNFLSPPFMFAMRENAGTMYSIYRLEDSRLCYVVFEVTKASGFMIVSKEVIVYPLTEQDSEEKLSFLLDKDRLENILPTSDVDVTNPAV